METNLSHLRNVTDSHSTLFDNVPGWVITVCASIVLGYLVQISGRIKGRDKISLLVVPFAMIINLVLTWHLRVDGLFYWIARQSIAGMVVGFVAWICHATILRKIEQKFPFFQGALAESGLDETKPKEEKDEKKP